MTRPLPLLLGRLLLTALPFLRPAGSFSLPLRRNAAALRQGAMLTRVSAGGPFEALTEALSSLLPPAASQPPATAPRATGGGGGGGGGGRREQFWREVAFGLAERFESFSEVDRVVDYTMHARGELPLPSGDALAPGHEPCEEYVPGLAARPFWPAEDFAWARRLEGHADEIRAELRAVLAADAATGAADRFAGDSALQTQVMGGGWSALRLQRLGRWNEENCARFPRTTELLKELAVPTAMRGVMFARQQPGTAVARHSDGRNFVLTAHLGLEVPSDDGAANCWVSVAGERRQWAEGEVLVLDTSFHHETANASEEPRDVLIIDFWHPELSPAEVQALQFIYDLRYEYDRAIIEATSA